ncbi:hypothetical protein A2631_00595 [Candidatus Daviesbacteria bacterium RIFCSPHIGHO2_01_FULL_44_29]|uniref:Uncharacterized protein n=1 Tax=Candidatus Daviesbacteria bacterium RIFCSPHIGHO2_02_FULL_43_12 TaxID=1797776 RepID=A0A1F5KHB3_9BACT|nr:MAG: hypothetical protein A2631_00595 [Candidatus Daviesbacteria bacterium RIFCSPHIGHO2_01_FULL_44_29]OGE39437.1 MAG: hypothetical protein A3E86_01465 [Candidatus Daviesbacteria bacterium RIFCSPHIGHO2_12_FULL_47_45]OGE40336.1 MAG: hypothetical protein A3D25_03065 [Candidatus Daviesbacteria bacterium RIFCSPHIGHO2_02_FULL_43_12]OGE69745.1 MAG: hypothetical protein A3B55_02140 [Candidatus Daviesbacteria bacterium RIFCSPLOWO2_01_FULL_43_15]
MIDGDYHALGAEVATRLGRRFVGRRVGGPLDGATQGQRDLAEYLARKGFTPSPHFQVTDADIAAVLASGSKVDFSQIKGDPVLRDRRTALLKGVAMATILVSDLIIGANKLETSHGPHLFYSKTHAIPVGGNSRGFDPEMVADARALEQTARTGLSYSQLRGDPTDEPQLAMRIQLYPLSLYSLRKRATTGNVTDEELLSELVKGYLSSIKTNYPPARTYFNFQFLLQPGSFKPGPPPITGFTAVLNPLRIL